MVVVRLRHRMISLVSVEGVGVVLAAVAGFEWWRVVGVSPEVALLWVQCSPVEAAALRRRLVSVLVGRSLLQNSCPQAATGYLKVLGQSAAMGGLERPTPVRLAACLDPAPEVPSVVPWHGVCAPEEERILRMCTFEQARLAFMAECEDSNHERGFMVASSMVREFEEAEELRGNPFTYDGCKKDLDACAVVRLPQTVRVVEIEGGVDRLMELARELSSEWLILESRGVSSMWARLRVPCSAATLWRHVGGRAVVSSLAHKSGVAFFARDLKARVVDSCLHPEEEAEIVRWSAGFEEMVTGLADSALRGLTETEWRWIGGPADLERQIRYLAWSRGVPNALVEPLVNYVALRSKRPSFHGLALKDLGCRKGDVVDAIASSCRRNQKKRPRSRAFRGPAPTEDEPSERS